MHVINPSFFCRLFQDTPGFSSTPSAPPCQFPSTQEPKTGARWRPGPTLGVVRAGHPTKSRASAAFSSTPSPRRYRGWGYRSRRGVGCASPPARSRRSARLTWRLIISVQPFDSLTHSLARSLAQFSVRVGLKLLSPSEARIDEMSFLIWWVGIPNLYLSAEY